MSTREQSSQPTADTLDAPTGRAEQAQREPQPAPDEATPTAGARAWRPRVADLFAAGLFVAALASLWNYLGALLHPNALTYSGAFWLEDIKPTYYAARAILAGHGAQMYDPAVVHGYTYSPFFAWIFQPLALFSFGTAGAIWYTLCQVWLWLAVIALARLFADVLPVELQQTRIGRLPLVPLLAAVWLGIPPHVQATLDFGQVDYLILALLAWSLVCLRRERDLLAGALVVLAALLKFTPFGLLAVFLVFRRWRALASSLVTLVVVVAVTSLDPRVGFQSWLDLRTGVSANFEFIFRQYANESLGSILAHVTDLFHKRFPATLAEYVGLAIAVVIFALALVVTLRDESGRGWRAPSRERAQLGVAACIGALLLSSPLNWDHSFTVATLPAVFLLGVITTRFLADRRMRWWQWVGVVAAAILASWPMTAALNAYSESTRLKLAGLLLISARPLALLAVTLLLIWLLARRADAPEATAEAVAAAPEIEPA